MRIGVRLAISGLVLASIIVTAVGANVLWCGRRRRPADACRHDQPQIVSAVDTELATIAAEARSAHTAIRTLVPAERAGDPRSGQARIRLPVATAIAAGHFVGRVRLAGRCVLRRPQARRSPAGNDGNRISSTARSSAGSTNTTIVGDIQFEKRRFEDTDYVVTDQEWYRDGIKADKPRWFNVSESSRRARVPRSPLPVRSTCMKNARAFLPYHRTHQARAVSVATLGRKIRRRIHPRPRRQHDRRT